MVNEYETRQKYIDTALKKVGWIDKYIKEEINPVKSDFKNKKFVFYNGEIAKKYAKDNEIP